MDPIFKFHASTLSAKRGQICVISACRQISGVRMPQSPGQVRMAVILVTADKNSQTWRRQTASRDGMPSDWYSRDVSYLEMSRLQLILTNIELCHGFQIGWQRSGMMLNFLISRTTNPTWGSKVIEIIQFQGNLKNPPEQFRLGWKQSIPSNPL